MCPELVKYCQGMMAKFLREIYSELCCVFWLPESFFSGEKRTNDTAKKRDGFFFCYFQREGEFTIRWMAIISGVNVLCAQRMNPIDRCNWTVLCRHHEVWTFVILRKQLNSYLRHSCHLWLLGSESTQTMFSQHAAVRILHLPSCITKRWTSRMPLSYPIMRYLLIMNISQNEPITDKSNVDSDPEHWG